MASKAYSYDARNQVTAITDAVAGNTTLAYDGAGNLVQKEQDSDTSGAVVARYESDGRHPVSMWNRDDGSQALHHDALGSVVATTDNSGGIKSETIYDAWGKPVVETGSSANKFGYTGHQMDKESGLIYFQARYYDPGIGRFITQDPFEGDWATPLSLHHYLYAYANPTVYIDLDGRVSVFRDGAEQLRQANEWLRDRAASCGGGGVCATAGAAIGVSRAVTGLGEVALRGVNVLANTASLAAGTVGINSQGNVDAHAKEIEGTLDAAKHAYDTVTTAAGWKKIKDKIAETAQKALDGDAAAISDVSEFGAGFVGGGSAANVARNAGKQAQRQAAQQTARQSARAESIAANEALEQGQKAAKEAPKASPQEARTADALVTKEGPKKEVNADSSPAEQKSAEPRRSECPCCFAAGTPVLTANGFKAIEDIREGDQVASRDEVSGEVGFKPVTVLIETNDKAVYVLTLRAADGKIETLTVTDNHPFWVLNKQPGDNQASVAGWVESAQLTPGMQVQTHTGATSLVLSLTAQNKVLRAFNFEVADFHTYFVGQSKVWVHNSCACSTGADTGEVKPGQIASAYPRGRRVGGRGESARPTDPPSGMREAGAWDPTPENLARMEKGKPPIGRDGLNVELHHRDQNRSGPLDELTSRTHDTVAHPVKPSQIDRGAFRGERERYWRSRVREVYGQE